MRTVKTVLYGVGAVGSLIARFLLQKEGIEIVGAIDVAQEKVGRDLGEILGTGGPIGIKVSNDTHGVLTKTKPDIVIHATSSYLKEVFSQLQEIVRHGVDVVSTCEELSYPSLTEPQLAYKLDRLAKRNKATVLGTGINPGFLMDTLVITLTAPCQKIERVKAVRVMNAATRRVPFQKKIGAGLSKESFYKAIEERRITGHVGLGQSIAMIAAALGWKLERIEASAIEPVIAQKAVKSKAIKVKAGNVAGLRQIARGYKKGIEAITLDFQAYIGAGEEYDSVTIEGVPCINQRITPCVHGDIGTIAMVVNAIPRVINAPSGLLTMKDLPVPSAVTESIVAYLH
jgi:4-hydroxy-tetrahydrodipicolinate reductase